MGLISPYLDPCPDLRQHTQEECESAKQTHQPQTLLLGIETTFRTLDRSPQTMARPAAFQPGRYLIPPQLGRKEGVVQETQKSALAKSLFLEIKSREEHFLQQMGPDTCQHIQLPGEQPCQPSYHYHPVERACITWSHDIISTSSLQGHISHIHMPTLFLGKVKQRRRENQKK